MRQRSTLVASLFALVLTGCVWSQPGFGPDRQAFQPFEHSINPGNVGSLKVAWTATLDGTVADPISENGAVYANTSTSVYEFRLGNGSQVWVTKLTDPTFPFQTLSRVSATHGMIVAPRLDFHGSSLQRLNATTGAIEAPLPSLGGVDAAITRGDTLVAPTLQWGTNFCLYGIVAIDVTGPDSAVANAVPGRQLLRHQLSPHLGGRVVDDAVRRARPGHRRVPAQRTRSVPESAGILPRPRGVPTSAEPRRHRYSAATGRPSTRAPPRVTSSLWMRAAE